MKSQIPRFIHGFKKGKIPESVGLCAHLPSKIIRSLRPGRRITGK
jgi:hypothetical protein